GRQIGKPVTIAVAKAVLDDQVLSFDMAEIAKSRPDRVNVGSDSSGRRQTENPNPSDLRLLLRARRERPRNCRASKQGDELASLHSITSSASASSPGGTVRPSAFAVLRLITSSNFVGRCTGRSAGLAPLRMRST